MTPEKEWIKKIIDWCAENGKPGQTSDEDVSAFMKTALQECARPGYGNLIYREMSTLPDEKKRRVIWEMLRLSHLDLELYGAYETIVKLAEKLVDAKKLLELFDGKVAA